MPLGLKLTPGDLVPIIFEKSLWAIVAMLGILKAGGAFVPIDPSQGPDRREGLLRQTSAKLVLVSRRHAQLELGPAVVVGPGSIPGVPTSAASLLPRITPSALAYVLFTSGSTG